MRTTLDIADDVLAAVKERARREKSTAGEVLTALARSALVGTSGGTTGVREPRASYGFSPFASQGKLVTDDHINNLRERESI